MNSTTLTCWEFCINKNWSRRHMKEVAWKKNKTLTLITMRTPLQIIQLPMRTREQRTSKSDKRRTRWSHHISCWCVTTLFQTWTSMRYWKATWHAFIKARITSWLASSGRSPHNTSCALSMIRLSTWSTPLLMSSWPSLRKNQIKINNLCCCVILILIYSYLKY